MIGEIITLFKYPAIKVFIVYSLFRIHNMYVFIYIFVQVIWEIGLKLIIGDFSVKIIL